MTPRVLVAGIGNIFFGDDAFGVEVVRRLAARPLPTDVVVKDFGIRGLDLAYALLDGPALAILVDAVQRGQPPGTLVVIEPDVTGELQPPTGHGLTPDAVLALVRSMGELRGVVRVVGCEAVSFEPGELSPAVAAAVDAAVRLIEEMVAEKGVVG